MLNELKKYRKGLTKDLSFLDNNSGKKTEGSNARKQKKRLVYQVNVICFDCVTKFRIMHELFLKYDICLFPH